MSSLRPGGKGRGYLLVTTSESLFEAEETLMLGRNDWGGDRGLGSSRDDAWAGLIWDSFCRIALSGEGGIDCLRGLHSSVL